MLRLLRYARNDKGLGCWGNVIPGFATICGQISVDCFAALAMTRDLVPRNDKKRGGWKAAPFGKQVVTTNGQFGRSMVKAGEVQYSQSAGLLASPRALSKESLITYVPSGTV